MRRTLVTLKERERGVHPSLVPSIHGGRDWVEDHWVDEFYDNHDVFIGWDLIWEHLDSMFGPFLSISNICIVL